MFGQSLVWFSIRGVFAEYLDYCAQYPDVVGRDWHIDVAANEFRLALNAVSEFLSESLIKNKESLIKNKTVDLTFLKTFLQSLERKLKEELDGRHFRMYEHYLFWIGNYEWLKKVPFGVVAVVEVVHEHLPQLPAGHYYQKNPYPECPLRRVPRETGFTRTDCIWPEDLIADNAYRLYPIISTDYQKKPYFVWVGAPSRLTGDHEDARLRFCERMTLGFEPWHKELPDDFLFDETTLPMLIHQRKEIAEEIANAENSPVQPFLQERWDNRKAMYGMHLYPGFGREGGFGLEVNLLKVAGELAYEASRYATVLPDKDETTDKYGDVWRLREPKAAQAAYFPKYDAMFFWGPADGVGWDLFEEHEIEQCEIRLVPISYDAVRNAKGVKSGGRPMWMEPRTDDLLKQLHELAT